jgi:recombinational DNA repair protein (RecF pathway)
MIHVTPPNDGELMPAGEPYQTPDLLECVNCGSDDLTLFSLPPKSSEFYCHDCHAVLRIPIGGSVTAS